jgi:hypothetical protein
MLSGSEILVSAARESASTRKIKVDWQPCSSPFSRHPCSRGPSEIQHHAKPKASFWVSPRLVEGRDSAVFEIFYATSTDTGWTAQTLDN